MIRITANKPYGTELIGEYSLGQFPFMSLLSIGNVIRINELSYKIVRVSFDPDRKDVSVLVDTVY